MKHPIYRGCPACEKNPTAPGLMGCQAQTASASQSAGGGPNPSSYMMSPHRPARMIRLRYCCFGATSYIIDADRSTLSFDPVIRP